MEASLKGRLILIAENEPLIALDITLAFEDEGAWVIRPTLSTKPCSVLRRRTRGRSQQACPCWWQPLRACLRSARFQTDATTERPVFGYDVELFKPKPQL